MNHVLHTSRLFVREFTPEDAGFILSLVNTSGWHQFIGDKNVHTTDDALNYLGNGPFQSYQKFGFGMWHVSRRDNGEPVGMCGILKRPGLPYPDLGFAFMPGHQGKGYAIEAARATVEHGFHSLNIETLFAITMHLNVRAQALLAKIGMTYQRDIVIAASGKEDTLMLYQISKTQVSAK